MLMPVPDRWNTGAGPAVARVERRVNPALKRCVALQADLVCRATPFDDLAYGTSKVSSLRRMSYYCAVPMDHCGRQQSPPKQISLRSGWAIETGGAPPIEALYPSSRSAISKEPTNCAEDPSP